jgi:hypothetical protein
MRKLAVKGFVLTAVIAVLGIGSYAIAGGGTRNFDASPLNGYEENPDISTVATGSFDARLSKDGASIHYKLSYSGLEGDVLQSHVHFGKAAVNGGISFFLCANGNVPAPAPAGTPACPGPHSGTVEDDIVAADVIGPTGQGIEAANLPEILAAMRAGHAYANVHSTKWPGGEIRAQINDRGEGRGGGDD